MATVQEPRAGNRFESFVEAELSRAGRRIQAQDIGAAALGLLVGTLAFALGMILLDRWLDLSDTARQVGLFGYLAAAIAYAIVVLSRPLRRVVNPYFAARQVERAVPGAKNSVISWLDLHAEPLPESIRTAVSQKAAADIKKADVDEVVRDGRLGWLGGVAGGLFVAALILFFLLRPNQFMSLLGRAFAPFGSGAIASQTSLGLLMPATGDVTVPVNSAVDFRVEVLGRVPDPGAADAVRLRFRYNPADPVWEEIRLDPSPRDPREIAIRMPGGRVQNGFVYQIVGGDAATPEYRVHVRSSPLIEAFEVGFHFRPYLHFRDETTVRPNIESLRGTQVTLTAKTNRTIKSGSLTFLPVHDGQAVPPPIPAEAVPDQPAALRFRFVLTDDAKYQINFQSVEGERNEDPIPYTIKVLADHPPQVEVTRPAPDTLPVNGTIAVEGKAADDFGITAMRLCLRIGETDLAPKPYRPGKVFKFADDTYPRALDYKDFLPLDQLKTKLGAAVALKPKMVIEYWLEADDNCDHPKPNVGTSKRYKVTLADPQEAAEKQAGDKQAAGDKAEHDQKQDQDLNRENEAKKQAGDKGDQGEPNGDKPDEQPKEGDPQSKPEGNPTEDAKRQELEKQMQKAKEALDKQQKREEEQKGQGEPKGEPGGDRDGNPQSDQPGEPKPQPGEGKPDPKENKPQPSGDTGENKPDGQAKSNEAKPQPNGDTGENKPDGKPQPNGAKGENQPGGQAQPGEAKSQPNGEKGENKPDGQAKSNEAKPQPNGNQGENKPDGKPDPGDAKPQPASNQGDKPSPGEQKSPNGGQQNEAQQNPGEAKPQPQTGDKKEPQKGDQQPGGAEQKPNPDGTPSENPKKNPDAGSGQQKPEPGAGGQADNKNQSSDKTGQGPKNDPNNREPNGKPNPMDSGHDGDKSKTGSRQPGDGNPNDKKQQDAPSGQSKGGAPDPGEAKPMNTPADGTNKGEAKPSGGGDAGEPKPSQPGTGSTGQGDLKDAPKAHDQPGGTAKQQPKTDGVASDRSAANDQKRVDEQLKKLVQDLKSGDAQTRQAAENRVKDMAQELAKQGTGQKTPDPQAVKAAEERAKQMLKSLDKDPEARHALENAMKNTAAEAGKEELAKLAQDLKSGDAKTRDAAKERAKQLAQGDLKPVADDAKSGDPQRQQKADELLKELEKDPAAREALLDALRGDSDPQNKDDAQAGRQGGGGPPKGPISPDEPAGAGPAPDPKNANKTSDLQLERFPKNPSKELLQDLAMTEEQYRQFLKDAAELQRKRQTEADNNRLRGDNRGRSAANSGAKRVVGGTDKPNQLERGGASLPPEEYRDGYKGFTEDVSKTAGGVKKD